VRWITEAQKHAAELTRARNQNLNPPGGLKEFATFVVEFQKRSVPGQSIEYQTTVHHSETDTTTKMARPRS
jgi:hypothetical protein